MPPHMRPARMQYVVIMRVPLLIADGIQLVGGLDDGVGVGTIRLAHSQSGGASTHSSARLHAVPCNPPSRLMHPRHIKTRRLEDRGRYRVYGVAAQKDRFRLPPYLFFFLLMRQPPRSTLFPYTTLFR